MKRNKKRELKATIYNNRVFYNDEKKSFRG